ncbi:hypothetical protein TSUD_104290 [Trifolium subterraneum]|uniref:Uncharacterized protein n=1 Tax=Trifolium subterraneum TaxID=3900 RepID=A0A2Z6MTU6_TRISU|nr:hypothetical protein TSUD_104290 [Trifolium subterraneum]
MADEKKATTRIWPGDDDDDDSADVDAVKNVSKNSIAQQTLNPLAKPPPQSPASKNICGVHRLDQQILNKLLENLKNSITHETLNQLAKPPQLAEVEDNEIAASPVPLQAPTHEMASPVPSAAAAVNNVSEEITQLPASKKTRYAQDDEEEIQSKVSEERI